MVTFDQMQASNAQIGAALGPGLVAVFAGATSGIGETALKQFAKQASKPRIYFMGRSKASGERIAGELKQINQDGEYNYISVDVSLMKSVDDVCKTIRDKEKAINLLFLTTGTLVMGKDTEEGLNYPMAVAYYARMRFIVNLLPLIRQAQGLRRVVTVFAAGKEGSIDVNDLQARKVPLLSQRGHGSAMMTTALETIAKTAPEVSFIHNFPGAVQSDLGKDVTSPVFVVLSFLFKILAPLITQPYAEAGDKQVFFSTSAKYPPATGGGAGVPLPEGVSVARGTDGKGGSGVYSIHIDGESAPPKVEELLAKMRAEGVVDTVWTQTEAEFVRITGTAASV